MKIRVRQAQLKDIDWIVGQAKEFSVFYGSKLMIVDEAYAKSGLSALLDQHIILVAESQIGLLGFIVGILGPHPFNPKIKTLSEMLWWVTEPYRHSRAGYLLLKEYIRIGKEKGAQWLTMCSLAASPLNESSLIRRGFRLMERSYLMEV